MKFGERLEAAMDLMQWGPSDLAVRSGVAMATISAITKRGSDRTNYKERLVQAFPPDSVSHRWLRDGTGRMGDGDGAEPNTNTLPGPAIRGQVPLISWVRAGELCESHDNYHPGDAEHWMDCPVPHGPRTYCLAISGDSMDDSTADAYRDGEIIFVDPDANADPGRDVVVRTPDNKTTFKRLKEDQEGQYLLGLNGKKIVRVPEDTVFCGVVIFSGRRR